jgi:acyl-CoA hydrolase
MHTLSARKSSNNLTGISCLITMVLHVDQTKGNRGVLINEERLSNRKGLTSFQKIKLVIEKCVHHEYAK